MTKLRFWVSASFLWLALLLNIERLYEPVNIASFVYVMAAALSVVTVVLAPEKRRHALWLVLGSLAVFLLLKAGLGYTIAGEGLPLTIMEAVAILVTIWLGRRIALSIRQFERSVFELAALHWVTRPLSFKEMQDQLYREVRRARLHDRPLSLVAVRPDADRLPPKINALIEETQQRLAKHYLDVQFAELLASEVEDCDLIVKYEDHFLLLLAEADEARARDLIQRLASRVHESLGVDVRTGVATFPEEEVTLAGLLNRAEKGLLGRDNGKTLVQPGPESAPDRLEPSRVH